MIFRYPHLKGSVEIKGGEIVPHGDPELKYMKSLMEKAENWKEIWETSSGKPDINSLSDSARQIVTARLKEFDGASKRIQKEFMRGGNRRQLWRDWLAGESEGLEEAVNYFVELQEYQILNKEA